MLIVDAQIHIWGANTPERPWPGAERNLPRTHREEPWSAAEVLREMDAVGVHRAVLVPPSYEGDRNDLVLEAAQKYPERFAAMGRINMEAADARNQLAKWREQRGMLGIRCTFTRAPWNRWLADGAIDWLWDGAEQAALPITMLVPQANLQPVNRIAERHPGLKLTIDHFALHGPERDEDAFRHFDKLLALAQWPNVAVKASALPCFASDGYPFRRIHTFLRRAYDAFGPKRMFWGTDLSRLPCTYREGISMFTEEVPWFTSEDKEWIMGRGICEWLGWKLPLA